MSPRTQYLLHNCIEGVARWTLYSKKVPVSRMRLGFTIIAHNVHHSLQVWWHGLLGNIPCPRLPGGCHGLLRHDRLLANWTTIIKAGQLTEAMGMNRVATRQILRRLTRGKHVFAADWTIVLVLVLEAIVRVEDVNRNAHAALATMSERLNTADAAKATFVAVKRFLGARHPEVANTAMVFSKHGIAVDAQVSEVNDGESRAMRERHE